MEHHGASDEALRKATQHLQQLLLLRTPGKPQHIAASEAEAIAQLAFVEGNPVRELFVTAKPKAEPELARSPSPTGTIRPKSSKAFFKFGRGRDKSSSSSGLTSNAKQPNGEIVSPLFEQCFGPIDLPRPKKKERVSDVLPPTSSTGTSKGIQGMSCPSQQKPVRVYEQYRCIVCDHELSSKGVCKRHLELQHVTPKVFECEGCHAYFDAKPEAKKHCSQCGDGETGFIATTLSKKVYACEYTGGYFSGQARYIDHLLALSEQKTARPKPDLNLKLEAILRHAGVRNAALMPLCASISQSLFGSEDGWKELQYDGDFLRAKITVLEYATFNSDGTLESTRWTGSAPRRRNTESYLAQLFQAGRLPSHSKYLAHIKPGAMSICSTPVPVSYTAPSIASGSSNADTPLRITSPYPRSHSRQTIWSHDGMDQSTTASTPHSVPTGDDFMTAELKTKRHLSDESRAYIPARTPPGPPELPDHYQYHGDPTMISQAPQLPPIPTFITPSGSQISLPLRKQEANGLPTAYNTVSLPPHHPIYQMNPANSSHTLTSDAASETSTLAQSYREPEFSEPVPIDYNLWAQQQLALQAGHPVYPYGNFDYSMADDASMVASSINTGHTVDVEYINEIPKMESYSDMDISHYPPAGTYYVHDGGEEHRDEMR